MYFITQFLLSFWSFWIRKTLLCRRFMFSSKSGFLDTVPKVFTCFRITLEFYEKVLTVHTCSLFLFVLQEALTFRSLYQQAIAHSGNVSVEVSWSLDVLTKIKYDLCSYKCFKREVYSRYLWSGHRQIVLMHLLTFTQAVIFMQLGTKGRNLDIFAKHFKGVSLCGINDF